MTYETLCEAIDEAKRFLERAKVAKQFWDKYYKNGAHNASARRSSMDLTRALAKMRKY